LASKFKLGTISKTYFKFGKDLKGDNKIGFMLLHSSARVYGITTLDFKILTKGIIQILYDYIVVTKTSRAGAPPTQGPMPPLGIHNLRCGICNSDYKVEIQDVSGFCKLNLKFNKINGLMVKLMLQQTSDEVSS